jgi:hypothetical protein
MFFATFLLVALRAGSSGFFAGLDLMTPAGSFAAAARAATGMDLAFRTRGLTLAAAFVAVLLAVDFFVVADFIGRVAQGVLS